MLNLMTKISDVKLQIAQLIEHPTTGKQGKKIPALN